MLSGLVLKQWFLLQAEKKCSQYNLHYMQAKLEQGIPICLKINFLLPDNDTLNNNSALNVLPNDYADNVAINIQRRFEFLFHDNLHAPVEYHFQFLQQAH